MSEGVYLRPSEALDVLRFWDSHCQGEIPDCVEYRHSRGSFAWFVKRGSCPLNADLISRIRTPLDLRQDRDPRGTIAMLVRALEMIEAVPTDPSSGTNADEIIFQMCALAQRARREAHRQGLRTARGRLY